MNQRVSARRTRKQSQLIALVANEEQKRNGELFFGIGLGLAI